MTEAEMILTSILNCRRVDLYVDPQLLDPFQIKQFKDFQSRRENHEPLQYILGQCEFMDIPLKVDERVLIPRPETEILVETVLDKVHSLASGPARTINILDIGTGSGNIAIALAKHIKEGEVTAVDFSQGCLDLAARNAKMNSVQNKIQFIQSDVFSSLKAEYFHGSFDVIVSNPPYIPTGEMDFLPQDVRHEPPLALDGGADGLDFYRRMFQECGDFLKPNGLLIVEIGADQAGTLKDILSSFQHLKFLEVKKDLCQRDRVLVVQIEWR